MPPIRTRSPDCEAVLQPNLEFPVVFVMTKGTARAEVEISVEQAREFGQALIAAADKADSHMEALQAFLADAGKLAPPAPPPPPPIPPPSPPSPEPRFIPPQPPNLPQSPVGSPLEPRPVPPINEDAVKVRANTAVGAH